MPCYLALDERETPDEDNDVFIDIDRDKQMKKENLEQVEEQYEELEYAKPDLVEQISKREERTMHSSGANENSELLDFDDT